METEKDIFDIVDARDEVIGWETRTVVHREGLRHRAVHVFVFDSVGRRLYLQRRSMKKDTAPGKWVSSCSGHVDRGEAYDNAAIRELGEEIGLSGWIDLERVFKEPACWETGQEFVWLYQCRSEGPFELDPEEVAEGKWIELEKLDEWMERRPRDFARSFVYLWRKYRSVRL